MTQSHSRLRRTRNLGLIGIGVLGAIALSCGRSSDNQDTRIVVVLGSITGEGQEKLEQIFVPFTEATGIEVVYEGTDAFATVLPVRVDGGNPPDIALFPQPGLMADFARDGHLIALDQVIDASQLATAYTQDWLDLGSVDGQIYGLWARADVKSLVWYRPEVFAANEYDIPATWDEMMALAEQIVADGGIPWCLGIESGAATGWVGTDWVEDIMLRTAGPEVYDQWVNHEIPFTDAAVQTAFEDFGAIALNPNYVVGGTTGIISTPFGDAPQPLFSDPPGCFLHRQTNFIASFFPDKIVVGEDVNIFLLPEINPDFGQPVLVAGTAFAMLSDRPDVQAVMNYLATAEPHELWVSLENYVSPHRQVTPDLYTDAVTQQQAEILASAEIIRFDASDLMPGEVGTGTFWTGIVDYIGGEELETVLTEIEASWPDAP